MAELPILKEDEPEQEEGKLTLPDLSAQKVPKGAHAEYLSRQLAAIRSRGDPQQFLLEAPAADLVPDKQGVLTQEALASLDERRLAEARNELETIDLDDPQSASAFVQREAERASIITEIKKLETATERAAIASGQSFISAMPDDVRAGLVESRIADQVFYHEVSKIFDKEIGLNLGTTTDALSFLISGGIAWQIDDIEESLVEEFPEFSNLGTMDEIVQTLRQLPFERRKIISQEIVRIVKEETAITGETNNLKNLIFLSEFIEPDPDFAQEAAADLAFLGVDLASLGAVKGIRTLFKLLALKAQLRASPIVGAKLSGNTGDAAEMAARAVAGATPEERKAMGLTDAQMSDVADPVKFTGKPEELQGIAPEVHARLMNFYKSIADFSTAAVQEVNASRMGVLSAEQRQNIQIALEAKLEQHITEKLKQGVVLREIQLLRHDEFGGTIQYVAETRALEPGRETQFTFKAGELTEDETRTILKAADGTSYFSDEVIETMIRDSAAPRSTGTVVLMDIDDFMGVAPRGFDKESLQTVRELVQEGTGFFDRMGLWIERGVNNTARVRNHEGRHRALVLKELGVTKIPVWVEMIPGKQGSLRWDEVARTDIPDRIHAEFPHDAREEIAAAAREGVDLNQLGGKDIPMPNSLSFPQQDISFVKTEAATEVVNTERVTRELNWGIDPITGGYGELDKVELPGQLSLLLGSPNYIFRNIPKALTAAKQAGLLDDLSARTRTHIIKLYAESLEPLTRLPIWRRPGAKARLDKVLIAGDEYVDPISPNDYTGTTFSIEELRAGVPLAREGGQTVKLLTDEEVEAYYKFRLLSDVFEGMENEAVRSNLRSRGVSGVKIQGQQTMGTVLTTADNAASQIGNSIVYNASTTGTERISPKQLQSLYDKGYVAVRIEGDEGFRPVGVKHVDQVRYAVVKGDAVGDLPARVKHKKAGYIPKVNQGVEWVVKELVPVNEGGKIIHKEVTRGFATSEFQANRTIAQLSAKEGDRIELSDSLTEGFLSGDIGPAQKAEFTELQTRGKFIKLKSDEFDLTGRTQAGHFDSGGLFNSPRSTHEILWNGQANVQPDRLNVFDTYTRQIGHVANLMTRNNWRLIQQQNWVKAARQLNKNVKKFGDEIGATEDDAVVRTLNRMHDEINHWTLLPTRQEGLWESSIQNLHDWSVHGLGKINKFVGFESRPEFASLLSLKHKNPFAALRTAAFHFTLGVFTPVQLWVQAQGAAVSLTRYPKQAPRAIGRVLQYALLDNIQDPKAMAAVARDMGGEELLESYQWWRKSGFRDSIFTTADHAMVEQGVGASLGAFRSMAAAASSLGNKALAFYSAGELFNRRMAFILSDLARFDKTGKRIADSADLATVMTDARLSLLELSKANAAIWQGGPNRGFVENLISVGLQFKQISAKTIEKTITPKEKGGLTGGERFRIAAGQLALYGAAGIPMGNWAVREMEQMTGAKLDREQAELVNQGMWGWVVVDLLDADVNVSNRGSLVRSIQDFVYSTLFAEVPMVEKLFGAAGSVGLRFWDLFGTLGGMALKAGPLPGEVTREELEQAMIDVASLPSVGNNIFKALMMNRSDELMTKYGRLIQDKDYNAMTEAFTAFGFVPNDEQRSRALRLDQQARREIVSEAADAILFHYNRYNVIDNQGATRRLEVYINLVLNGIDNKKMQNEVRELVYRRVAGLEQSELGRLSNQKLDEVIENMADEAMILRNKFLSADALVSPVGVLPLDVVTEESRGGLIMAETGPFRQSVAEARQGQLTPPRFTTEEQITEPLQDDTFKVIFGHVGTAVDAAKELKEKQNLEAAQKEFGVVAEAADLAVKASDIPDNALDEFLQTRLNPLDPRAREIRRVFDDIRTARDQGRLQSSAVKTLAEARMRQLTRQNPGMEDLIVMAARERLGFDPTGSALSESLSRLDAEERAKASGTEELKMSQAEADLRRVYGNKVGAEMFAKRIQGGVFKDQLERMETFRDSTKGEAMRTNAREYARSLIYSQGGDQMMEALGQISILDAQNMGDQDIATLMTEMNRRAAGAKEEIRAALRTQEFDHPDGVSGKVKLAELFTADHIDALEDAIDDEINNLRAIFDPKQFKEYLSLSNDITEEGERRRLLANPVILKAMVLGGKELALQVLTLEGIVTSDSYDDDQFHSFLHRNPQLRGLLGSRTREEFAELLGSVELKRSQGETLTAPERQVRASGAAIALQSDLENSRSPGSKKASQETPQVRKVKAEQVAINEWQVLRSTVDEPIEAVRLLSNERVRANLAKYPQLRTEIRDSLFADMDRFSEDLANTGAFPRTRATGSDVPVSIDSSGPVSSIVFSDGPNPILGLVRRVFGTPMDEFNETVTAMVRSGILTPEEGNKMVEETFKKITGKEIQEVNRPVDATPEERQAFKDTQDAKKEELKRLNRLEDQPPGIIDSNGNTFIINDDGSVDLVLENGQLKRVGQPKAPVEADPNQPVEPAQEEPAVKAESIISKTIEFEGGERLTNNPDDPGGVTKFGISKRFNPDLDVANLTREEAEQVYKRRYWNRVNSIDALPPSIQAAAFDMAVHHGPREANKAFEEITGLKGKLAIEEIKRDPALYTRRMAEHRFKLLRSSSSYAKFRNGFERRGRVIKEFSLSLLSGN